MTSVRLARTLSLALVVAASGLISACTSPTDAASPSSDGTSSSDSAALVGTQAGASQGAGGQGQGKGKGYHPDPRSSVEACFAFFDGCVAGGKDAPTCAQLLVTCIPDKPPSGPKGKGGHGAPGGEGGGGGMGDGACEGHDDKPPPPPSGSASGEPPPPPPPPAGSGDSSGNQPPPPPAPPGGDASGQAPPPPPPAGPDGSSGKQPPPPPHGLGKAIHECKEQLVTCLKGSTDATSCVSSAEACIESAFDALPALAQAGGLASDRAREKKKSS